MQQYMICSNEFKNPNFFHQSKKIKIAKNLKVKKSRKREKNANATMHNMPWSNQNPNCSRKIFEERKKGKNLESSETPIKMQISTL